MGRCHIAFTEEGNALAAKLLLGLTRQGVVCRQMDVGFGVTNHTGRECPRPGQRMCTRGAGDGAVVASEVFEFALDHYDKYQKLLEGVLGEPLPWVLDDRDPATPFDAEVRRRVSQVIELLTLQLRRRGIRRGSAAFEERMALGLLYLVATPDYRFVNLVPPFLQELEATLDALGLGNFRQHLQEAGGFYVGEGLPRESSALEAIRLRQGKCTELARILFAVLRFAGLKPRFVRVSKLDDRIMRILTDTTKDMKHVCIGLKLRGRMRLLDPTFGLADARHREFAPQTLRQRLAGYYSGSGEAARRRGDLDVAIAKLSRALEINAQDEMAHNNLGAAWVDKGEIAKGIASFRRAIAINPRYDVAYSNLGGALLRLRRFKEGEAELTHALRLRPDYATALSNRGVARIMQGDVENAILDFDAAIKMTPEDADLYANRAAAWLKKGDRAKASVDLKMAARLRQKQGGEEE